MAPAAPCSFEGELRSAPGSGRSGGKFTSLPDVWNKYIKGYRSLSETKIFKGVLIHKYEDLVTSPRDIVAAITLVFGVPAQPRVAVPAWRENFDGLADTKADAQAIIRKKSYLQQFTPPEMQALCARLDISTVRKFEYDISECDEVNAAKDKAGALPSGHGPKAAVPKPGLKAMDIDTKCVPQGMPKGLRKPQAVKRRAGLVGDPPSVCVVARIYSAELPFLAAFATHYGNLGVSMFYFIVTKPSEKALIEAHLEKLWPETVDANWGVLVFGGRQPGAWERTDVVAGQWEAVQQDFVLLIDLDEYLWLPQDIPSLPLLAQANPMVARFIFQSLTVAADTRGSNPFAVVKAIHRVCGFRTMFRKRSMSHIKPDLRVELLCNGAQNLQCLSVSMGVSIVHYWSRSFHDAVLRSSLSEAKYAKSSAKDMEKDIEAGQLPVRLKVLAYLVSTIEQEGSELLQPPMVDGDSDLEVELLRPVLTLPHMSFVNKLHCLYGRFKKQVRMPNIEKLVKDKTSISEIASELSQQQVQFFSSDKPCSLGQVKGESETAGSQEEPAKAKEGEHSAEEDASDEETEATATRGVAAAKGKLKPKPKLKPKGAPSKTGASSAAAQAPGAGRKLRGGGDEADDDEDASDVDDLDGGVDADGEGTEQEEADAEAAEEENPDEEGDANAEHVFAPGGPVDQVEDSGFSRVHRGSGLNFSTAVQTFARLSQVAKQARIMQSRSQEPAFVDSATQTQEEQNAADNASTTQVAGEAAQETQTLGDAPPQTPQHLAADEPPAASGADDLSAGTLTAALLNDSKPDPVRSPPRQGGPTIIALGKVPVRVPQPTKPKPTGTEALFWDAYHQSVTSALSGVGSPVAYSNQSLSDGVCAKAAGGRIFLTEWSVVINKQRSGPLGKTTFQPSASGHALVVVTMAGGPLDRWNSAHPEKEVRVGDTLVEVNGARGNQQALLNQLSRTGTLKLRFLCRLPGSFGQPAMPGAASRLAPPPIVGDADVVE